MPYINKLYFKFRNHFSRCFPKIYCFCDNRKSLVKFFIAGSLAGIADLVFLFIFHGIFNWPIILSTSLAFISSFMISFTLQKLWTFRNFSQTKVVSQFILYILNAIIGLNLNGFFMRLLVTEYNVWYLLAQIIVNVTIGTYNFFIFNFIIFKIGKDEINNQQKTPGSDAGNVA